MKKRMLYIDVFLLLLFTGCAKKENASIGIIGGADVPTAIFLASSIFRHTPIIAVIFIVIIIGTIIYINRKKK